MDLGESILVDYDNQWNTYKMMEESDLAVTINSQAGLEASIRGVPTVVCGQAFYANLGFTREAGTSQQLEAAVVQGLSGGWEADWEYSSRCFAHIFFQRYCVKKTEDEVARLMGRAATQWFPDLND